MTSQFRSRSGSKDGRIAVGLRTSRPNRSNKKSASAVKPAPPPLDPISDLKRQIDQAKAEKVVIYTAE